MKSNRKRDHISDAIRIRTLSFPMEFLNIVVNEFPHSADFIRKPWVAPLKLLTMHLNLQQAPQTRLDVLRLFPRDMQRKYL